MRFHPLSVRISVSPVTHSSSTNTLYSESRDCVFALSIILLASSTLLLEAASISIGSPLNLLISLANILAEVVL